MILSDYLSSKRGKTLALRSAQQDYNWEQIVFGCIIGTASNEVTEPEKYNKQCFTMLNSSALQSASLSACTNMKALLMLVFP